MVFDGFVPLVKRCDGFDASLWSTIDRMSDGLETEWTDVKGGSCVTFKKVLRRIKTPFTHSDFTSLQNFGSCPLDSWLAESHTLETCSMLESYFFY